MYKELFCSVGFSSISSRRKKDSGVVSVSSLVDVPLAFILQGLNRNSILEFAHIFFNSSQNFRVVNLLS
jgi:hypothetical protein